MQKYVLTRRVIHLVFHLFPTILHHQIHLLQVHLLLISIFVRLCLY
nr:MAG TPA: hypothetical protein [Bacteriophage sp.]